MSLPDTSVLEPLGRRERRVWAADPSAYGPRRARRGGAYEVFIPSRIATRGFPLDDEAVTEVADAAQALQRLAQTPPRAATLAALARNLLRSESVASSRIEGLRISHKRLARASFADQHDLGGSDHRAQEVLGNVNAMRRAIEIGAEGGPLTVPHIQDIHRTLLHHTADAGIAGVLRQQQNWIGGNDHNPIGATFVPPPHDLVGPLLEDLCEFIDRTDVTPVAQAAIAHAQFENIHPFADGNGRTGRALIYTILRRREQALNYIPPISLVLAREPRSYINGIGAYGVGKVSVWCARFADATARAARGAEALASEVENRQAAWIERLGNPRADAASRQLVRALPDHPVIDVAAGREITGKSHVAVGRAFDQLERVGVIRRLNEKRWGRVWECNEILDLAEEFEKRLL